MSVNTVPRFIEQPKSWVLKYSGNTPAAADGSGAVRDLVSGGAHGSKVNKILANAEGDTEDSLILLYLQTSGGTNHLIEELIVDATSAGSGKVPDFGVDHTPTEPYIVPSGWKLSIGVNTTSPTFVFTALGGDY